MASSRSAARAAAGAHRTTRETGVNECISALYLHLKNVQIKYDNTAEWEDAARWVMRDSVLSKTLGPVQGHVRFLYSITEGKDRVETFVLLDLYKEVGRCVMVSAAYYLTVADLGNSGVAVNRDAAVVPVVAYQTSMSIGFRLEVSNYDDPRVALATCLSQGVLEVVLRLTAPERDAWINGSRASSAVQLACDAAPRSSSHRSSLTRRASHRAFLAKSFSAKSFTLRRPDASERVAAAHERYAVVKQFHARMILVDMWAEYAGIYIGSLVLFLGQRMPLFYSFRPYRKHP